MWGGEKKERKKERRDAFFLSKEFLFVCLSAKCNTTRDRLTQKCKYLWELLVQIVICVGADQIGSKGITLGHVWAASPKLPILTKKLTIPQCVFGMALQGDHKIKYYVESIERELLKLFTKPIVISKMVEIQLLKDRLFFARDRELMPIETGMLATGSQKCIVFQVCLCSPFGEIEKRHRERDRHVLILPFFGVTF